MKRMLAGAALAGAFLLAAQTALRACDQSEEGKRNGSAFRGVWRGTMDSPVVDSFRVEIEIKDFAVGKWCGTLKHPEPVDATGKLLGVKLEDNKLTVAQTIFEGRDRCLDGLNELILVDRDTLRRVWIDPATGRPRDVGVLKRQR